ncbi:hypothetical protein ILUMI_03212, partial [Ignelater luminosus]
MPYDLYCPSLKDERHQLVGRTCKQCGIFAQRKMLRHRWSVHYRKKQSKEQSDDSAAPIRNVTRRSLAKSGEVLCVVRENHNIEWLDEDDFDLQNEIPTVELQDASPFVSVENSQVNP